MNAWRHPFRRHNYVGDGDGTARALLLPFFLSFVRKDFPVAMEPVMELIAQADLNHRHPSAFASQVWD